jgi:hypothetical protein
MAELCKLREPRLKLGEYQGLWAVEMVRRAKVEGLALVVEPIPV